MFKGSKVMDLLAAHWSGHNGVTCYGIAGPDWVYHTLSYVRAGKEVGEKTGCIEAFQSKRGAEERDDCYLCPWQRHSRELWTHLHTTLSSKCSPENLSGVGGNLAFFNSSWLETFTAKATWLLSDPLCPDSSARPDLNLKHRTIARERREVGSEAVEQWPYVGLGSAAGGSIGEYFIRAWAKFFPNENIHISPKVRPRHMGMFINIAARSSDIDN